jgi:hypothetical protein
MGPYSIGFRDTRFAPQLDCGERSTPRRGSTRVRESQCNN